MTRITPAPAGDGALAESAIVVNNSDSPLSESSEEAVRYSQWDNLGMSYDGSFNLTHRAVPSFSFKGAISRPRSTSSSSSARATTPCLSIAALQDGSYQPSRAYHTTHVDRYDLAGARGLFPDLAESYVDWDFVSGSSFEAFMTQRQDAMPDERPALWCIDGAWQDRTTRETPSLAMIHMTHYGPLPPIWKPWTNAPTRSPPS